MAVATVAGCLLLMSVFTFVLVILGTAPRSHDEPDCDAEPDMCRNVSQLITSKGYPCEVHTVQTNDGFLLTVQRIPYGRMTKKHVNKNKPLVFLQHGLLCSASNWVTNLANESLAFLLADAGYDVWLGNVRGNTYSRKHIKFNPSHAEFWTWSFDEMAKYDLPAMVNYALNKSSQNQLYYVGHSQGTLMAFIQLSRDKQLADKVRKMFALAPVAYVKNIKGALKYFSYITGELKVLFDLFGVHDFLPNAHIIKFLAATLCDDRTRFLCEDVLFLMAGFDTRNFNESRLPVYLTHTPAGTSVQNIVHFAQMVQSGNFQMYDYGKASLNLEHYGQVVPPKYNAKNVSTQILAYTAGKDWLADPEDVQRLLSELPHVQHVIDIPEWNHLDFIWGMDAPKKVYDNIIKYINNDISR